jgi:hypothetical protein
VTSLSFLPLASDISKGHDSICQSFFLFEENPLILPSSKRHCIPFSKNLPGNSAQMREFPLTELHHLVQLALATTKISMLERKY